MGLKCFYFRLYFKKEDESCDSQYSNHLSHNNKNIITTYAEYLISTNHPYLSIKDFLEILYVGKLSKILDAILL